MISRMTFSGFVRTKVVSCRSGNQPWPMRDSLDDEYVSRALLRASGTSSDGFALFARDGP